MIVMVPKAAIHKNDGLPFSKDKIGSAGKAFGVQSESQTQAIGGLSNGHLGRGVLSAHRSHHF